MNALMQNVLTGEIIDHFRQNRTYWDGVLRHVDDVTFTEDPLRVLRAAGCQHGFRFLAAEQWNSAGVSTCLPFRENA